MLLSPEGGELAKLMLKHFGGSQKPNLPVQQPVKPKPTEERNPDLPQTNKEKYSLDYSKWESLDEQEKQEQIKNLGEEEYKKMFGCFHDRRKERQLYEKSTREKLEAAERFKKEGNKFFQNKEYAKADIEYQKALIQFDYAFPDTPEEEKDMEKLQEQVHTNVALVKFYQKDYKECISQCSLAIKINKDAMKPRYRRACAYLEIDDYENVLKEIEEGLKIDAKSADFIALKEKLSGKMKQYEQKNEQVYKKMFGSS